jgi:hypothetical protein
MGFDCTLYVERRTRGGWEEVQKWHLIVAHRARARIQPAGVLTQESLNLAESTLLLENAHLGELEAQALRDWYVLQNYDLFGRLAGVRGRGPALVQPRGWPADTSPRLRDLGYQTRWDAAPFGGSYFAASHLTLREMEPLRGQFLRFTDDVLTPMRWAAPGGDPDRVRAVFCFCD